MRRPRSGLHAALAGVLVAASAGWLLPLPASAQRHVKVESKNGQYKYERTNTRGGVRLLRQISRDPCIEGQTWGFDRDGIWVDKGCRAEFEVGESSSQPPPTGRLVTVESQNWGHTKRRVGTRGGVRLYRQLSRDACVEGQTWGFDRDGIWVDKGCRAEFEILERSFFTPPANTGRTVLVESKNNQREYRRINTRGGVRLLRQLSKAPCNQGVTWGFDRDGIWVDQGCRAEFEIGG